MDFSLLHPKIVHVPMALAVLMPLVSTGLLLAIWRGWLADRTWVIALLLQALLVASGVAALKSGEADEERVERFVSESLIHDHEEAGEAFVWSAAGVLVIFALAAVVRKRRRFRFLMGLAVAGTLLVVGLGLRVGRLGGELVYRHGAASAWVDHQDPPAPAGAQPPHNDDD